MGPRRQTSKAYRRKITERKKKERKKKLLKVIISHHQITTYSVVKIGDIIAPYCARPAGTGNVPFVVGDKQRIHIPHQHNILH